MLSTKPRSFCTAGPVFNGCLVGTLLNPPLIYFHGAYVARARVHYLPSLASILAATEVPWAYLQAARTSITLYVYDCTYL